MKKTFSLFLTLLAFMGMLSAGAVADDNSKKAAPAGKEAVIPVKALKVKPTSNTFVRRLPATLMTTVETRLAFRVSGRITDLPVAVGQVVKKGDLIALLDPKDFKDTAGQAEAALAQATARQKEAGLHLARMQKLWANQDVDISQLDKARADERATKDQVKIQKKQLNEASRRLSYTRLMAPFTGIVAQKKVNAFDTVSAEQPIVLFVDLSRLKARAQLSPSLMPERNRFETYNLVIPALKGLRLPATLEGIGPSALPQANTYPITVIFKAAPKTDLRPGMNGLLEITVRRRANDRYIQIPPCAVDTDPKGSTRVWVVDEKKGVVQPRQVLTGGLTKNGIEIKKGLNAGEWVVTAGIRDLRPGQRVLILKSNP